MSRMPAHARTSGLETFRAVLRRHNPGFDVIFEIEGDDRTDDALPRKVGRGFTAPQDADPLLNRIDVSAPPIRAANHDRVDEPDKNLTSVGSRKG